jgi:hypothetical protein
VALLVAGIISGIQAKYAERPTRSKGNGLAVLLSKMLIIEKSPKIMKIESTGN